MNNKTEDVIVPDAGKTSCLGGPEFIAVVKTENENISDDESNATGLCMPVLSTLDDVKTNIKVEYFPSSEENTNTFDPCQFITVKVENEVIPEDITNGPVSNTSLPSDQQEPETCVLDNEVKKIEADFTMSEENSTSVKSEFSAEMSDAVLRLSEPILGCDRQKSVISLTNTPPLLDGRRKNIKIEDSSSSTGNRVLTRPIHDLVAVIKEENEVKVENGTSGAGNTVDFLKITKELVSYVSPTLDDGRKSIKIEDSLLSAEKSMLTTSSNDLGAIAKVKNEVKSENETSDAGNTVEFLKITRELVPRIKVEGSNVNSTDTTLTAQCLLPSTSSYSADEPDILLTKEEDLGVVDETDEPLVEYDFLSSSYEEEGAQSEGDNNSFQVAVSSDGASDSSTQGLGGRKSKSNQNISIFKEPLSNAQSEGKSFFCKYCTATFKQKWNLTRHLTIHTNEKLFMCAVCCAKFKQKSHLKSHLVTHSGEKPFSCPDCTAKFRRKTHLEIHLRIHTSERPHLCTYCPAKFIQNYHLKRHLGTHLNQNQASTLSESLVVSKESKSNLIFKEPLPNATSEEKSLSCTYCPANFEQKSHLTSHLETHTDEKLFTCAICCAKFKAKEYLKRHLKIHTNERPYLCTDCPAKFARSDLLKRHQATHSNERLFVCTICCAKFKCQSSFKCHLGTHSGEKPFSCIDCTAKFKRKSSLKTHSRIHSNERPYFCTYCPSKFKQSSHLKSHLRTHVNQNQSSTLSESPVVSRESKSNLIFKEPLPNATSEEKSLSGTYCPANFEQKSHLTSHLGTHTDEKLFTCAICCAKFKAKKHLKNHLKIHTNERPYLCNGCSAKFARIDHLKRHLATHTNERPFVCTICCTKFKHQHHLKDHLGTHSGEKPFSCIDCTAKFKRKSSLKTHSRIHSNERPYLCTYCPAKFIQNYHLKRHLGTHINQNQSSLLSESPVVSRELKSDLIFKEPLPNAPSEKKSFFCTYCPATFKQKSHLTSHQATHTNERPFSCTDCTAKFRRKDHLEIHLRTHTNERPYSCIYCPAKFARSDHWKRHLKTHINQNQSSTLSESSGISRESKSDQ